MATYFHWNPSEIQGADHHGMQTLYLMNPNYMPYSDTTLLLNPAVNALNPTNLPHAPPSSSHHHPLEGTPLPGPTKNDALTDSEDINNRSSSLHGTLFSGVHYDSWGSTNQNSAKHHHSQIASLPATTDIYSTHESSCRQGLSLSLSPKQAAYNYRSINNGCASDNIQASEQVSVAAAGNSPSLSASVVSNGIASIQNVILESKYLRAAQELLDEVVNVFNVVKAQETKEKLKMEKESTAEGSINVGGELTTAQKQELQLKKAKLVNMLDEVEQRYRQYHDHMKVVMASFEQAGGLGSAKSYTALALRTISKQFRCLKDAISEQMKATSKKLGEEDCLGAKVESSRQRYVADHDRQLRQQLGMIQHNAWRPQRGLPERAVSVLRAWLFEHFLHPYPKDADKQLLAKQTGLTRGQVSNWFINARVRLWKPMVEEMYLEEMKEQENENGDSGEIISKTENSQRASQETKSLRMKQVKAFQAEKSTNQNASPTQVSKSTISTFPMGGAVHAQTGFNIIGPSELEGVVLTSPKKPRCTNSDVQNSPSSILAIDMDMKQGANDHGGGGFGAYTMEGIGRLNPDHQLTPRFHGNGVSLTLGLPQQSFLSNHQHNIQVGRGLRLGPGEADLCGIDQTTQQTSHPSTAYENIEIQNRKRFAAQLLPDFVA
ncbi:hypothetical protein ACOSQ2_016262 [Xanthoceras sorbifolium]